MAAIPSSGSLMATHDYYWCHLGSASSNSYSGSGKYPREAIPHHPASSLGSPLSHSWPQFWSPQSTRNPPRLPAACVVTGSLASEATRKQPLSQSSQANTRPPVLTWRLQPASASSLPARPAQWPLSSVSAFTAVALPGARATYRQADLPEGRAAANGTLALPAMAVFPLPSRDASPVS
ncbi:pancreatic progenitor cell differentiation and proliferation factor-like [Erethizon dorsatum]